MDSFGKNLEIPKGDSIEEREERMLYLLDFLKKIDKNNIIEDLEEKRNFVNNLSYDEFKKILVRLNGVLRDIPILKREISNLEKDLSIINIKNQDNVTLYVPPPEAIKDGLLKDAFESFQRMINQGKNIDASKMVGCAINAVHPFEDGNGRTSRIFSLLFASSKNKFYAPYASPETVQLLVEDYVRENNKILGSNIKGVKGEDIDLSRIPLEFKVNMINALKEDKKNFVFACILFLRNKKREDIDNYFSPSKSGLISFNDLFSKNEGNIREIMNSYIDIKKEYVLTLIDIFENPEKYLMKKIPKILESMSPRQREFLEDKNILDVFNITTSRYSIEKDSFSWDFLIKFTKGEVN